MLRRPIAFTMSLALSWGVYAYDARPAAAARPEVNAPQPEQALKQKRRDGLREAFKIPVEEVPASSRQLNAQEKAELREQLRQQQLDSLK
jgi:hypothetical protein